MMYYYKTIAANEIKIIPTYQDLKDFVTMICLHASKSNRLRTDSGTFSGNSSSGEDEADLLEDARTIKSLASELLPSKKTLETFFKATFSLEFLKWEIDKKCRLKNILASHGISFKCKNLDLPAQRVQGWNQKIEPKFNELTLHALKQEAAIYKYPLHPVFISAKEDGQRGVHRHDKIVQTIIEEESKKELATFKDELFQLFKKIAEKKLEPPESLLKAIAIRLHPVLSTVNVIKKFTVDDLKLNPAYPADTTPESELKIQFNSFLSSCFDTYSNLITTRDYIPETYTSIKLRKALQKATSTNSLVAYPTLPNSAPILAGFPMPKFVNKDAVRQAEEINSEMQEFFKLGADDFAAPDSEAAHIAKQVLKKGYSKFKAGNYPLLITLMDGVLTQTKKVENYKSDNIAYDTTVWLMVTYIIDDIAEKLPPDGVDKLYDAAIELLKSDDANKESRKSELKTLLKYDLRPGASLPLIKMIEHCRKMFSKYPAQFRETIDAFKHQCKGVIQEVQLDWNAPYAEHVSARNQTLGRFPISAFMEALTSKPSWAGRELNGRPLHLEIDCDHAIREFNDYISLKKEIDDSLNPILDGLAASERPTNTLKHRILSTLKEKVCSIINRALPDPTFSMKDLTDSKKLHGLLHEIKLSLPGPDKDVFNELIDAACQEISKEDTNAAWILKAFPRNLILMDSYSGDVDSKGVVPDSYTSQQPLERVLDKRINGYKSAMIKTQIVKGIYKRDIVPLCEYAGLTSKVEQAHLMEVHYDISSLPFFKPEDVYHVSQRELWITATTAWSLVNGRYNPPEICDARMEELKGLLAK